MTDRTADTNAYVTLNSEHVAKRLGLDADGLVKQEESATLFAELKAAGALTGLDDKTLESETNSARGTREEMRTLFKNRRTPLNLNHV